MSLSTPPSTSELDVHQAGVVAENAKEKALEPPERVPHDVLVLMVAVLHGRALVLVVLKREQQAGLGRQQHLRVSE
eukprot:9480449-Pyramimonas_sp.AAC.1